MREVVTALRGLLGNETVSLDGYHVQLDGVELDYVYQERRAKDVPIYIGATGMQMMELAGEIADGVVLNYLVDPAYNVTALDALQRGAQRAGRSVDDLDRPQLVICSIDRERKQALDAARLMVTQYLGQQPHLMKASGVPQELLDDIAKVMTWPATHEEVAAASRLVPDEVVQRCTASGEPDEVVAKVAEYMANGCTCPILYPLGPDVGAAARHVRPSLTACGKEQGMRITLPSGTPASLHTPDGDVSMGLVVATDILGVRPLFDDLVERLAKEWSMAVCAVDPFPGRDLPLDPADPHGRSSTSCPTTSHLRDLLEGAAATGQERVGVIGFCMGGMYTLEGGALRSLRPTRRVLRDDPGAGRLARRRARASRSNTSPSATRTGCWRSSESRIRTRRPTDVAALEAARRDGRPVPGGGARFRPRRQSPGPSR